LAQSAGVSAGAISNYENDVSSPSAPALRRICQALAGILSHQVGQLWHDMGEILDLADSYRGDQGGGSKAMGDRPSPTRS
jgi:transcriptional regulator with XRE-family HTH domain